MPTYDYRCETNDRVMEVHHRMSEEVRTWGELCTLAGIEPGDTAIDSPVKRLATGGNIIGTKSAEPPCGSVCGPQGGGCPGGMCSL